MPRLTDLLSNTDMSWVQGCPTQPHRNNVRHASVWPTPRIFIYLVQYPGYFVFDENLIRDTIATIVTSR